MAAGHNKQKERAAEAAIFECGQGEKGFSVSVAYSPDLKPATYKPIKWGKI
jgi:hypothetical protein